MRLVDGHGEGVAPHTGATHRFHDEQTTLGKGQLGIDAAFNETDTLLRLLQAISPHLRSSSPQSPLTSAARAAAAGAAQRGGHRGQPARRPREATAGARRAELRLICL